MKKILFGLALVGALSLSTREASALSYTDHDNIEAVISTSTPFTGTFDIVTGDNNFLDLAGYDSANETILSATVQLVFADNDANLSTVTITLQGGQNFFGAVPASFFLPIGGDVLGNALIILDQTGILTYTVSAGTGSDPFLLNNARLDVVTGPRSTVPVSVPDGGTTISLLGAALIGLGFLRRRLS